MSGKPTLRASALVRHIAGVPSPLPPALPHTGHRLLGALARALFRALGWRFEGEIPDAPKLVAIVAPHTSNWDFIIGLIAKWALELDASWLGKNTLFTPPFGALFRRLGGIPVDRTTSHDVVASTIAAFGARKRLLLAIAPEGTRKAVAQWKTGFYHIAAGAGVPILLIAFDWRRKVIRFGPTVTPGSDAEGDVARIREQFAGVAGRNR